MEHNNVIELNGKRYDAVTGKYLGKGHAKPVPAAKGPGGKTIDGVVRAAGRPSHHLSTPEPKPQPKPRATREHHKPHNIGGRQPQHTKTLMRHAVAKPKPLPKKPTQTKSLDRAPENTLAVKESVSKVNPYRQQRANLSKRHQHIQRFQAQRTRTTPVVRDSRPAQTSQPRQQTATRATTSTQQKEDYNATFEAAIAHATSHQQPSPRLSKKRGRKTRLLHATLAIVLVLSLGGIFAWTQRAQIELQVASWQTGVDARMPGYSLTDYKRSAIRQEHGNIIINYQSGDSHYRITQQASRWNSQTLLDQDVAGSSTQELQTVESKGRTVYIYGNNASWVDGGVRYDINGNAPLNTNDILAIIDSM